MLLLCKTQKENLSHITSASGAKWRKYVDSVICDGNRARKDGVDTSLGVIPDSKRRLKSTDLGQDKAF